MGRRKKGGIEWRTERTKWKEGEKEGIERMTESRKWREGKKEESS